MVKTGSHSVDSMRYTLCDLHPLLEVFLRETLAHVPPGLVPGQERPGHGSPRGDRLGSQTVQQTWESECGYSETCHPAVK